MAIPRQLPNAITIVRILCAPVFLWMLLADGGSDGALRWWAAVLFIVAIASVIGASPAHALPLVGLRQSEVIPS